MEDRKEDFIVILPRLANPLMARLPQVLPSLNYYHTHIYACMHKDSIEGIKKQLNCEIGERKDKCIKRALYYI